MRLMNRDPSPWLGMFVGVHGRWWVWWHPQLRRNFPRPCERSATRVRARQVPDTLSALGCKQQRAHFVANSVLGTLIKALLERISLKEAVPCAETRTTGCPVPGDCSACHCTHARARHGPLCNPRTECRPHAADRAFAGVLQYPKCSCWAPALPAGARWLQPAAAWGIQALKHVRSCSNNTLRSCFMSWAGLGMARGWDRCLAPRLRNQITRGEQAGRVRPGEGLPSA